MLVHHVHQAGLVFCKDFGTKSCLHCFIVTCDHMCASSFHLSCSQQHSNTIQKQKIIHLIIHWIIFNPKPCRKACRIKRPRSSICSTGRGQARPITFCCNMFWCVRASSTLNSHSQATWGFEMFWIYRPKTLWCRNWRQTVMCREVNHVYRSQCLWANCSIRL